MMMLREGLTEAVFLQAWRRVRRRGAPGADGISADTFARSLEANLRRLRRDVLRGRLRLGRLLRVRRRKQDGTVRILGVPTLADRIAQTAVLLCVTPVLDRTLADGVHGYRPGRSPATALRHLAWTTGHRPWLELLKLDIASMFDTIPHRLLHAALRAGPGDELWWSLCERWMRRWAPRPGVGIPQGAPLSPLLANLAMSRLLDDRLCRSVLPVRHAGLVTWIRYGDDIVLVSDRRGGAQRLWSWSSGLLRHAGMAAAAHKIAVAAAPLPAPLAILGGSLRLSRQRQGWCLQ